MRHTLLSLLFLIPATAGASVTDEYNGLIAQLMTLDGAALTIDRNRYFAVAAQAFL